MHEGKSHKDRPVVFAIEGRPQCGLTEVDRSTTHRGHTIINYKGDDGHDYHEFIAESGTIWLTTRIPDLPK